MYTYTGNNPVNYVDPTGHDYIAPDGGFADPNDSSRPFCSTEQCTDVQIGYLHANPSKDDSLITAMLTVQACRQSGGNIEGVDSDVCLVAYSFAKTNDSGFADLETMYPWLKPVLIADAGPGVTLPPAAGFARSNILYGDGGGWQYYIPDYQKVLQPVGKKATLLK